MYLMFIRIVILVNQFLILEQYFPDIEAYLGRNDSIYLTKDGELKVVTGADSLDPKPTLDPSTGILLGSVQLPPYLKSVYDANVIVEDTRQYTMRDIGKLEKDFLM